MQLKELVPPIKKKEKIEEELVPSLLEEFFFFFFFSKRKKIKDSMQKDHDVGDLLPNYLHRYHK